MVKKIENGNSPCTQKSSEVRKKRQKPDHYLKDISKITSCYGIFTIEKTSPNPNHEKYQTDDIDIEISKVFTENIKKITIPKLTKRKFTNDISSII